jgi:hypothetical protein
LAEIGIDSQPAEPPFKLGANAVGQVEGQGLGAVLVDVQLAGHGGDEHAAVGCELDGRRQLDVRHQPVDEAGGEGGGGGRLRFHQGQRPQQGYERDQKKAHIANCPFPAIHGGGPFDALFSGGDYRIRARMREILVVFIWEGLPDQGGEG